MARRQILSLSERESLLALPDDELTLTRMAYFSEHDMALNGAAAAGILPSGDAGKPGGREPFPA